VCQDHSNTLKSSSHGADSCLAGILRITVLETLATDSSNPHLPLILQNLRSRGRAELSR
jgi:hypothetical protein